MKIKGRITALLLAALMLLPQVPFTAFAEETTDIRADLLSPDTLPDGRVEVNYNAEFCFDYSNFNNGFNQYSWHIIDGELPPGLTLYPTGGPTWEPWINGTPTKAGTYKFTIQGGVTQYKGGKNVYITAARKTYTLEILPAYPLKINKESLYNGNEGSSYLNTVYEYRNRTVTWSMTLEDGGALPEGLSIDAETGKINWESPIAGKYKLKITATRGEESVSKVLKLIIEPGNGCTHTSTTYNERKHATCKENGMADYWYCDVCEGYFLDAECTRGTSADGLDSLYTVGFHSDENDDGKCDTCEKTMPIFTKVTSEDEITSGGMYLVVSKIGDKYYTLKIPEEDFVHGIEATEIEQNTNGTFSYPESDSDVMILKTEFAAECGALDAGKPRYSLGTTIYGIPYSVSSSDYNGAVQMYKYENNKYGYRMSLLEDGTPAIASVYCEYWGGESGKGGSTGILTAFTGTKNGETERFFSLKTQAAYENEGIYTGYGYEYYDENSLTKYPIELYKLTYAGTVGGQNYTLSDTQSTVTISSESTVINSMDGKGCSTVGGISEAVKTSYVESVISRQAEITGGASATTYADISLKSENSATDDYGYTSISSLVYQITPKIKIEGNGLEEPVTLSIDDEYFDGSEMTVSLCVGNMEPRQIIHHKADGTNEYFYGEHSERVKKGAKSFTSDPNYSGKGNFVTFTIDSFSDIEILAAEKKVPDTNTTVSGNTFTVTGNSYIEGYTVILALYKEDAQGNRQLADCQTAAYNGKPIPFTVTGDYNAAKVMVWEKLTNKKPVTVVENVNLEK